MFTLITIAYAHRQNADGTIDSICRNCFITVTTASSDRDLTRAEHEHTCDPGVLDYWNKMKYGDERQLLRLHDHYDYE